MLERDNPSYFSSAANELIDYISVANTQIRGLYDWKRRNGRLSFDESQEMFLLQQEKAGHILSLLELRAEDRISLEVAVHVVPNETLHIFSGNKINIRRGFFGVTSNLYEIAQTNNDMTSQKVFELIKKGSPTRVLDDEKTDDGIERTMRELLLLRNAFDGDNPKQHHPVVLREALLSAGMRVINLGQQAGALPVVSTPIYDGEQMRGIEISVFNRQKDEDQKVIVPLA